MLTKSEVWQELISKRERVNSGERVSSLVALKRTYEKGNWNWTKIKLKLSVRSE